ncbi:hypothetical protein ACQ1ZB_14910, partial [Enterococcus faecalis]
GPLAVALMTGSLLVDYFFPFPGIADLFVLSFMTNVFPSVLAVSFLFSSCFVCCFGNSSF